jgi:hypothetical protein
VRVDETDIASLDQLKEAVRMRQTEFDAAVRAVNVALEEAGRRDGQK